MSTSVSSSGLQLSGLASGIDWTSIVNELLTVEKAPETQMNAQITTANQKNAAYQALGSQLTTLSKDITNLSDPSFFDTRTSSVGNSSVATAAAASGTPLGTYTLTVNQLASTAVQQGTPATGKALSATNDVSGLVISSAGFSTGVTGGTFTVNGQKVTLATSDTLQAVFDKISTATNGTVTGSYNASTDEISLNSSSPIVLGSATDSSNFLQAAQLYNNGTGAITSTAALGGINLSSNLATANFSTTISDGGSGAGEFLINGVQINYNSSTDNVSTVLQAINNSSAGVTATYDSVNNRFDITNKATGDVGISLQDVTGNFLAATGLSSGTLVRGTNLQYTINNGGQLTNQTNSIDGGTSGITGLSISALAKGTTTITVGSDVSTISSAISSFVTDYNATQNLIKTQISPVTDSSGNTTPGVLEGDLDVENISSQLRQMVSATPVGLSGVVTNLGSLGILTNGSDNTLSPVNTTILSINLTNSLSAVKQMFSDPTNGIGTALKNFVNNVNGSKGALVNDESNMTKQVANINTSITTLNNRISQDQTRLTNEFVAMETAINTINSQKQYLNSFFSGSSSSSQAAPTAAGSSNGSSSSSSSSSTSTG